jgi:hypothetical protein
MFICKWKNVFGDDGKYRSPYADVAASEHLFLEKLGAIFKVASKGTFYMDDPILFLDHFFSILHEERYSNYTCYLDPLQIKSLLFIQLITDSIFYLKFSESLKRDKAINLPVNKL